MKNRKRVDNFKVLAWCLLKCPVFSEPVTFMPFVYIYTSKEKSIAKIEDVGLTED